MEEEEERRERGRGQIENYAVRAGARVVAIKKTAAWRAVIMQTSYVMHVALRNAKHPRVLPPAFPLRSSRKFILPRGAFAHIAQIVSNQSSVTNLNGKPDRSTR